jgi:hypothetical protein
VPRIADQSGGIRERLPRLAGLAGLAGWSAMLSAAPIPGSAQEIRAWLAGLADAAAIRYLEYGHGNPIMLVHSATAPTAILRTLPALPASPPCQPSARTCGRPARRRRGPPRWPPPSAPPI